jgi:hypothetical protein
MATIDDVKADLASAKTALNKVGTDLQTATADYQSAQTALDKAIADAATISSPPSSAPTSRLGISLGGDGSNWTAADLNRALDDMKAMGVKWLRHDQPWIQSSATAGINWTSDRVVDAALLRGITPVVILWQFPSWANKDPVKFGDFCGKAAAHFSAKGVHHFEIWNEPNLFIFLNPVDVVLYTKCLKAAYPAIKAADPNSVVISAGLSAENETQSGVRMKALDFLQAIYANGGKGYFDAVGFHPYGWPDLPSVQTTWNGWQMMASTSPSIRSIMVANGDGAKKIWATECGAPSNVVGEDKQASFINEYYTLGAAYDFLGPIFVHSYRDTGPLSSTDSEDHYGLVRQDWSQKPAYAAYKGFAAS